MHTRTVIYIHLVPPEARPCPLDRRVTSTLLKSQSALIAPPKYTNSTGGLYTWPAAVPVNVMCPPPFVCGPMIPFLAPETVNPNSAHEVTITVIIFSNRSGDRDTMPASSAYSIPPQRLGLLLLPLSVDSSSPCPYAVMALLLQLQASNRLRCTPRIQCMYMKRTQHVASS